MSLSERNAIPYAQARRATRDSAVDLAIEDDRISGHPRRDIGGRPDRSIMASLRVNEADAGPRPKPSLRQDRGAR